MKRHWQSLMVYVLIGLGVIGLLSYLVTNPLGILRNVLIAAVVIGVGLFFYKRYKKNHFSNNNDQSAFKRAAKQSSKRHKNHFSRATNLKVVRSHEAKKRNPLSKNKRKDNNHLKVIEGKKGKKKNRALF